MPAKSVNLAVRRRQLNWVIIKAHRRCSRSANGKRRGTRRGERAYFFMFLLASFRTASGVALPMVAISNAAFIELQNLPI